jgi:hypothetical protein
MILILNDLVLVCLILPESSRRLPFSSKRSNDLTNFARAAPCHHLWCCSVGNGGICRPIHATVPGRSYETESGDGGSVVGVLVGGWWPYRWTISIVDRMATVLSSLQCVS